MLPSYVHKDHPTNVSREANVMEWIRERQELEVRLAWDLLETFNTTRALIEPLRQMAEFALNEMILQAANSGAGEAAVNLAITDEKKVNMQLLMTNLRERSEDNKWRINSAKDLNEVDPGQMDAQECSDVVRLYGTFVEKASAGNVGGYRQMDTSKSSYRKEDVRGAVWNQKPAEQAFGRHRYSKFRDEQKAEYQRLVTKWGVGAVQDFLNSQKGGQAGFALADSSTIGRIDRTLGLVPAADISGTTTDTIFFIAKFGQLLSETLDPVYYMLPLATIVAGGHHSMLEVAASLSLNLDVTSIDYSVGFYTTLFPQVRREGMHGGIQNIRDALFAAENHVFNRHILVWFDRNFQPGGCYLVTKSKLESYKAFAKSTNLLKVFRQLPANPAEPQINNLCIRNGL